jgi:hypothetical protein
MHQVLRYAGSRRRSSDTARPLQRLQGCGCEQGW